MKMTANIRVNRLDPNKKYPVRFYLITNKGRKFIGYLPKKRYSYGEDLILNELSPIFEKYGFNDKQFKEYYNEYTQEMILFMNKFEDERSDAM